MRSILSKLFAITVVSAGLLAGCATPPPGAARTGPGRTVPTHTAPALIPATETRTVGRSVVNRVAIVRRMPSRLAARLAVLHPGTVVSYYGRQSGWTLIKLSRGRGWVPSDRLGKRRVRKLDIPVARTEPVRRRDRPRRLDIPVPRTEPVRRRPRRVQVADPSVGTIVVEPCNSPAGCTDDGGAAVVPGGS